MNIVPTNARESEPAPAAPKLGDLGKYRLIAELARGGMGVVYLALARGPAGFNKLLVVKELKPSLADEPGILGMFLDEARLAARLAHENVVQTLEVGSEDGRHYIVMEHLDGQTLHRLIARARNKQIPIPIDVHVRATIDALAGLHYAHELADFDGQSLGVVHRDVSPQNIFVTYSGLVKIVDFGIAKALDSTTETRTGVLKGKVAYLAPEQAQGLPVDRRADLFAVGVILFQALTGRRMWDGLSDMHIISRLVGGTIPKPSEVAADVPPGLEAIVIKATSVAPDDRYATAAEMAHALEGWLTDTGVKLTRGREIGKLVTELFFEDRARLRALVDNQMKVTRSLATGEYRASDILKLDLPRGSSSVNVTPSGTFSGNIVTSNTPSAAAPSLTPAGTTGTPPGADRPTWRPPKAEATPAPIPTAPPRRLPIVPAILGLALVGAVIALLVMRGGSASKPEGTSAIVEPAGKPALSSSSASPSPAGESSIRLGLQVNPKTARVTVDGAAWNATSTYARDDRDHVVRAEADGYVADERTVRFDRDRDVLMILEKQEMPESDKPPMVVTTKPGVFIKSPATTVTATSTTATAVATAPTTTTTAPTASATAASTDKPGGKPKHDIDKDDPFNKK